VLRWECELSRLTWLTSVDDVRNDAGDICIGAEQWKMTDGDQRSWSAPVPPFTRREASPGGVEFGSALKLDISRSSGWGGARAGRARGVRRQAEVSQDPPDHERLVNQRHESQPRTATRTGQDVEAKRPPHQLSPLIRPPRVAATSSSSDGQGLFWPLFVQSVMIRSPRSS
jgi:hypothetical protein